MSDGKYDSWTGKDKELHVGISTILGASAYTLTKDTDHPFLYATGLAIIPGVAKELYDSRPQGTGFSYKDLTADLVGSLVGVSIGDAYFSYNGKIADFGYHTTF